MPQFDCSREIVLPARPEQVWQAVATTEGNAAWLFPNEIDPEATEAYEEPHRFAVQQGPDGSLEFVIEDRGDGTSALRYAHCGVFPDEGFAAQNEAIQQHTDFYLHTLGEYLAHFQGRSPTYIGEVPGGIQGPASSATPEGFKRLQRALGLDEHVNEGESVKLTPEGLEPIDGVVDYLRPNFIGIRTADELYCFFGRNAFGGPVAVTIHAFNGGDPEQMSESWKQFLNTALA